MRRRVSVLLTSVLVAVVGVGVATAGSSSEQSFISYTNTARAHHGLRPYAVKADLTSTARHWAAWMAAHHTLAHNPALGSQVCCWRDLGENVGRGRTAYAIERAFMASSEHRAHILSRTFTQIGVGTARGSDGKLYVDELFRRPMPASWSSSYPSRATAPVAASRSELRRPRVAAVPSAEIRLAGRIAWVRRHLTARHVDPVREAVLYAVAMRVVAA